MLEAKPLSMIGHTRWDAYVVFCGLFALTSPEEGIMVTTMRTMKKTTDTLNNQAELRRTKEPQPQ